MFIPIFVTSYVIVFNKKLWIWKFIKETINVYIILLNIVTKSSKLPMLQTFLQRSEYFEYFENCFKTTSQNSYMPGSWV